MAADPAAGEKKRKMVKIGTHNGSFHCDEALGCWLLRKTPQFAGAEVVRTRDPEVLKDLDVVIDVGGVYDASANRFDHHQKEFQDNFGHGYVTRLSSAGLVYKHFGKQVIAGLLGKAEDSKGVQTVWLSVYKHFMEAIDGIDNGVNQWDSDAPPKYLSGTNLSSRVGSLNPRWNQESSPAVYDAQFEKAVELAGTEFAESVDYYGNCWLPARQHVVDALEKRMDVHSSGAILKLETFCPWKEHLYDIEKEMGIEGKVLYVLYQDQSGKWRIQCVSKTAGSFENRKSIVEAWKGLRDADLDAVTGLEPGAIFVHVAGFIGGHATYEGVLGMAAKSVEA